MAPLHVSFIRQNTILQLAIIIFFLSISSILHRPADTIYVFQSVLYFFPVYLIGIFSSIHKEKIYDLMKGRELYLLILAIFLAAIEALTGMQGNYTKHAFVLNGIDLMLFQKIILSLFFLVWLHRFEKTSIRFLEIIAKTSFGIFFLHGYLLWITSRLFHHIGISNISGLLKTVTPSYGISLILAVTLYIMISMTIVITLKKVIPKYSRYLTGY